MSNPRWTYPSGYTVDGGIIEFDVGWSWMHAGIEKLKNILEGNVASAEEAHFSSEEIMFYYTLVYNMCYQKPPHDYSGRLYEQYKQTFDEYITSRVLPSFRERENEFEFVLKEFVRRCDNNKRMLKWLTHSFHYLDRYFIVRRSLPTLTEVGLNAFHDLFFLQVKDKVRDVAMTHVEQDRKGDHQIDRGLLKNVLELFVEFGNEYYENDFEEIMLKETDAYYSGKASDWNVEYSCPHYLLKVEECLTEEKDRVSHYLPSRSEAKVLEVVQNALLAKHTNQLLENEEFGFMAALMKDDKGEDVSRLYRLFHKIPEGRELMANMFKQKISYDTMDLGQNHDSEEEKQVYMRKVAEIHEKYMSYLINSCFTNDNLFRKVIEEVVVELCNKEVGGSSSPELLASYCDNILKGDDEPGDTLEKVGKLVVYINDKDVFAEYYRNKLSRRLLIDKTANEDRERRILSTFKQQCGAQFTSKMEGMVTDITLAKDNRNLWKEYLMENYKEEDGKPGGIDLSVTVLTTGLWPKSYKPFDNISLPAEMVQCTEVFKEFYRTRTQNRKLRFINSMGTCNIEGKFESKTIHLNVSTYQAAVLLLFNSADRLSYSEIKTQLNLGEEDDDSLIRILKSLSSAKYKILIKDPPPDPDPNPNEQTVSESSRNEEYFEFNTKFTHRMPRVKIPWPSPGDEKKNITAEVEEDRRYAVDATIVRIMKSRKVLNHRELVMECVEQLGSMFKPDIKLIKQRIESLISRDFLARDQKNISIYSYVA